MTRSMMDAYAIVAPTVDTSTEEACCVFAQALVETWAGLPPATRAELAAWRLFRGEVGPWAPVEQAARAGVARQVSYPPVVPVPPLEEWLFCQGWRGTPLAPGVTGHTFVLRRSSEGAGGGRVLQIDSVAERGPAVHCRTWDSVLAEFTGPGKGGLAVAVLRRPQASAR